MAHSIREKLSYLSSDPTGVIQDKWRIRSLKAKKVSSSWIGRFVCRLKGVRFGNNCSFYGIPVFRRYPGSRITIGENVTFRSDFVSNLIGVNRRCIIATHTEGAEIAIGDNCGLSGTVIGAREKVILGKGVLCGANVLITDFDWHNIDPGLRRRPYQGAASPVIIEDNVWLGINVVVLKGATIGENSVIGANSVVTKDIPANVIAGGNPCKVIKKLHKKQRQATTRIKKNMEL